MPLPPRFRLKVVLLGEPMVGKTSLFRRYVEQQFRLDYHKTIGAKIARRMEPYTLPGGEEVQVELTIWDVMGQKRLFDLVGESYLTGAKAGLAVFDLTRPETLEALVEWIETARRVQPTMALVGLGNKADLVGERLVNDEGAREYCSRFDMAYLPTSAKTGQNVVEAFHAVVEEAIRRQSPEISAS